MSKGNDLIERIQEIIAWRATGIYKGTALIEFAHQERFAHFGTDYLRKAEDATMLEVARQFLADAATIATLSEALAEAEKKGAARPEADWHEDHGDVVWWCWKDGKWLGEPAWIGSPLCSNWPGYHTHWTPHPRFPDAPNDLAEVGAQ